MVDKNKIIIEYLKNKLSEIQLNIEKTQKEYPIENTFCYECGNHTHDASYNEQMEENFLLSEIRNLTTESEE